MTKYKEFSTLFGGILYHFVIGNGNTFSNMNTYITSYLRKNSSPDLTYAHSVWFNAVGVTGFSFATFISGYLTNKIGTRLTCLIGSILFSISIVSTSLTVQQSFLAVLFSYGLLQSVGSGLIYSSVIINCIKWFPQKRGFVTGLILSANCLSAVIFTELQTYYLNPLDLKTDLYGYFIDNSVLSKVPKIFIVLSIIFTLIQLFAFILTFNAEREHYLTEQINYNNTGINCDYNDNTSETNIVINSQNCDEDNNLKGTKVSLTLKEASQTISFYLLLITFALGSQPSYFTNLNKSFGETFIDDDQYLALVTSISFVTNAIGGVFWGHCFDYLGFKDCISCIYGFVSASLFSFIITYYYYQKVLFAIWNQFIYFTTVGCFACYLPEISRKFGSEHAITIYGVIHLGPALACIITSPLYEVILDKFGWFVSYSTNASFSAISMLIVMLFYENAQR